MKLTISEIKNHLDPDTLPFEVVSECPVSNEIIGQERAMKSLLFGLSMPHDGYHIYVEGLNGTGKKSYTFSKVSEIAKTKPAAFDYVYVHNFDDPSKPNAIPLQKGQGLQLKSLMENFSRQLITYMTKLFTEAQYQEQYDLIAGEVNTERQKIMAQLSQMAQKYGLAIRSGQNGLTTIPLYQGKVMTDEIYQSLKPEERAALQQNAASFQKNSEELFEKLINLENIALKKIDKMEKTLAKNTILFLTKPMREAFQKNQEVMIFIRKVEKDVLDHLSQFKPQQGPSDYEFSNRYLVNLFVSHDKESGAPVVFELNPTFQNLFGGVEYTLQNNIPTANHLSIHAGAIHRANGGYLILQVQDLMKSAVVWDFLKKSLIAKTAAIENLNDHQMAMMNVKLFPEGIPLQVKVILIGTEYLNYMLYNNDDEFRKLFKVKVQFNNEMEKTKENILQLSRFINTHREKEHLLDFDKSAVAALVDYSSRLADHQDKLSAEFNSFVETIYESNAFAVMEGAEVVTAHHVETALIEKRERSNLYEKKSLAMIEEGHSLIDVSGEKVGQINGLTILNFSDYSFGQPSRITVSTGAGQKGLLNIEKEVELSGAIHSKGVYIINGYLTEKFGRDIPLSLTANICFEQNYGGVDGDSASSTELYALLSSISGIPIRQNLAVTGSVNQMGEIQPIGGVNEKIEGFYRVCKAKGLTGDQGCMIPYQNVKNLVLNREVLEAIEAEKFHLYAVKTIEEGIELLTGVKAAVFDENGLYTSDCVYGKVQAQLREWHEAEDHSMEIEEVPIVVDPMNAVTC